MPQSSRPLCNAVILLAVLICLLFVLEDLVVAACELSHHAAWRSVQAALHRCTPGRAFIPGLIHSFFPSLTGSELEMRGITAGCGHHYDRRGCCIWARIGLTF